MDLQLIRLVGKSELPGHPFLYGTTPVFLEHFGLASLQQLNELDPTLQRSNPKKKAEQYKRQEKLELVEEAQEKPAADQAETAEAAADIGVSEQPTGGSSETADDDDVFIDDTPDEFDDEDEDENEEDGEEGEDEEGDGADGADDSDGV